MKKGFEDKHKIRDFKDLIEKCGKGSNKIESEYAKQDMEKKIRGMEENMKEHKEIGEISEQTLKHWKKRITKCKPFLDKYIADLEHEFGEKIEVSLIFLRVKHPCFHPQMKKNVVATNPYLDTDTHISRIYLTVPLITTWEELTSLDIKYVARTYLDEFQSMLKEAFERSLSEYGDIAKIQIDSIRNIVPIEIWKNNVDTPPHIVADVIWDSVKAKEHSTAYSDLLDLKKYTEYKYIRFVAPIMLDGEEEIAPVIAPKFEVEEGDIVNRIRGNIEDRLREVSGSVGIENTIDIEAFVSNVVTYSGTDKLEQKVINYERIGGVSVNDLREHLNDFINKADVIPNAPIEAEISGRGRDVEEIQRRRDKEYQIALMCGDNPQYSRKIDFKEHCNDLVTDFSREFSKLKEMSRV